MNTLEGKKDLTEQQIKQIQAKITQWRDKKQKLFKRYDTTFTMATVIFVISGILISLYNVPTFRQYAFQKQFFIAPFDSVLLWSFIGFIFNYIGRKVFFNMTKGYFKDRLHPKILFYNQLEQQDRLKNLVRQTFEGIFHMVSTFFIYYLFNNQDWFPQMIGGLGDGACSRIFETYPQWPANNSHLLLYFYEFQLGTYIYLILDLLVFNYAKYKTKNFGELFYHHFVSILLISISLFYNFVPIGLTVLFVHDASDFLRGFSRTIGESILALKYPKGFKALNYLYLIMFVYFRVIILPFCLIQSMYANNPSQTLEEWSFLSPQCTYLIVISCAIYSIQCYWAFFTYNQIPYQIKKNEYFVEKYNKQLKKQPQNIPQKTQTKKEERKNE